MPPPPPPEEDEEDDEPLPPGYDDAGPSAAATCCCCRFKRHLMDSSRAQTRALGALDYEALARKYETCAACREQWVEAARAHCDDPYGQHKGENFRPKLERLDDIIKVARQYPRLRGCRYVCLYCVNRARRERKCARELRVQRRERRREDRRLVRISIHKVRHAGYSSG